MTSDPRPLLSRLVNALETDAGDADYYASVGFDENGTIDDADFGFLRAHWSQPPPYR